MQMVQSMMKKVLEFATDHPGDVATAFVTLLPNLEEEDVSDISENKNIVSQIAKLAYYYDATHPQHLHPFKEDMESIRNAMTLVDSLAANGPDVDLGRLQISSRI